MKKITSFSGSAFSTLALAISTVASWNAHAAEQLETIIVTASKTEQDVQQTAVSVESISGDKLSETGVTSFADIAKITPGLQLDQAGGAPTATVRIRGIGTPGFSALDPSVPIFIDGVAQARTGAGFQDLLDVQRVEILRGPQGTLYGRNSTAGAISVVTKDANTRQWEGSVQAQVGDYNDRELKGTVNIPMVDGLLGARLSAYSTNQDGYDKNPLNGESLNGYADRHGGRLKVMWTPTADLGIQWITEYSRSVNHQLPSIVEYPALFETYASGGIASQPNLSGVKLDSSGLPTPNPYSDKNYYSDQNNWMLDAVGSTSITVNWDITDGFLANHSFTSISAYTYNQNEQDFDQDATVLDWASTHGVGVTRAWSQEFRLSSDAGEKLEYVGGLYYYSDKVLSQQYSLNNKTDALGALDRGLLSQTHDAFSDDILKETDAAIFGQATYAFTDQFSLTGGLRDSWAKKTANSDLDLDLRLGSSTAPPILLSAPMIDHEEQIERDISGVLKARYFVDESAMLYASYDRGFKPGGFNRLLNFAGGPSTLPTSYKKENSNNFEVGAKTQWLNNRLQANIALFHMDFINYHNQITDPITTSLVIENIKSVHSDGVELDVQALAATGVTVGASATYLNPRVADDKVGNGQSPTGKSSTLYNGQLINDVSQYSANLFADFSHPIADTPAEGFVRVDFGYRSRFLLATYVPVPKPADQGEVTRLYQGGYSTTSLRFGVRKLDEHWQLTGWVKNLTDKKYAYAGGVGLGGQTDGAFVNNAPPLTYGATVQYDY